jgi:hypothetical protein
MRVRQTRKLAQVRQRKRKSLRTDVYVVAEATTHDDFPFALRLIQSHQRDGNLGVAEAIAVLRDFADYHGDFIATV